MGGPNKMAMTTPDWILEGFDSKADWESKKGIGDKKEKKKSGKTFKVRKCPECASDDIGVIVEKEASGAWECRKCRWKGHEPKAEELTENEFMKYLDEKGEEVA